MRNYPSLAHRSLVKDSSHMSKLNWPAKYSGHAEPVRSLIRKRFGIIALIPSIYISEYSERHCCSLYLNGCRKHRVETYLTRNFSWFLYIMYITTTKEIWSSSSRGISIFLSARSIEPSKKHIAWKAGDASITLFEKARILVRWLSFFEFL